LSFLGQDRGNEVDSIVEIDETFFEKSEKGNRRLKCPGRKRGSSSSGEKRKKRGMSESKVAVIATADRHGGMSLSLATIGRIV